MHADVTSFQVGGPVGDLDCRAFPRSQAAQGVRTRTPGGQDPGALLAHRRKELDPAGVFARYGKTALSASRPGRCFDGAQAAEYYDFQVGDLKAWGSVDGLGGGSGSGM